ncbi:unnamed protein product [Rotaria sp. Silwood1]|nr:unnamed protein product [Rotaria sp. Silwood1]CAF0770241.1 unnamed protein product [Rotaria sp. Silwood1]CAF3321261.1 unnamed protein product [Rotaria sp. Silwood1]CAF3340146.1 unnamed protein product [Rotaria sp. Silwood1]CAF3344601.1 unnamed protein product [Rotaria sp. Silwood1]
MNSTLAVLVVIAHPDDETLFAGFIYALVHKINAIVDLVCITNGEGGFKYSAPSEHLYDNLQLSKESIGRQHLPRIHLKYDRNVDIVFAEQWNKEIIIQLLEQIIKTGNNTQGYDIMLIMLPSIESHGHHTASGLLALETIERLQQNKSTNIKIPTIIGGSEFLLNQLPIYSSNRLAEISSILPNEFRFNRRWTLNNTTNIPDYQTIVIWACSEHKSQGGLITETLTTYVREYEQYFYFSINNELNDQTHNGYILKKEKQFQNMSIPNTMFICVCMALIIPLLALSTSNQEIQEMMDNVNNEYDRFEESNRPSRQLFRSPIYKNEPYDNDHFILKKTADFEQILKPCNRMPATGRGQEYADCVRNRMLLMGRRKRRQTS